MRRTSFQDYQRRIADVVAFIEAHLDENLSLEQVAQVAHFSPFHFHRIFKGMTGESLKQHIRRLRLERAAFRLKHTSDSITRIAFDNGYESHEAFTRSFKECFGKAPQAFRRDAGWRQRGQQTITTEITRPPSLVVTDRVPDAKVNIVSLEPLNIAFLRHLGSYDTVPDAYLRLFSLVPTPIRREYPVIGIAYDDIEVTESYKVRFDVCVSITDKIDKDRLPKELQTKQLAGGRYARLRHVGSYGELHGVYQNLVGGWFPSSGYEPATSGCLEFYHNDPQQVPPQELVTDIHVPIYT